jgi:hypothetical protein
VVKMSFFVPLLVFVFSDPWCFASLFSVLIRVLRNTIGRSLSFLRRFSGGDLSEFIDVSLAGCE